MLDVNDRYRRAARDSLEPVEVAPDAEVRQATRQGGSGAWVAARVWVWDDRLEPEPGPTYDVWIAEQECLGPGPGGAFLGDNWVWAFDQSFTCDDDPDGKGARQSAHEYARHLRSTYPCAYVGVYPAGKHPLPIKHFTESSPL